MACIFEIQNIFGNVAFALSDRRQWKRDVAKCSFQTIQKRNRLKIRSYRRYGENGKKVLRIICSRYRTRRNLRFHISKLSTRSSRTAHATIDLRSRHRINPRPTRFASGKANANIDDCLEDIRWIRSLGSGRLPAASYAFLPNLQKGVLFERRAFCHRRGIEIFCRLFSTHQRPNVLYQTPGQRTPRITGRFVNTVTRGWIGAPNERAPFRFHGAVVAFVDRCVSRTRNLAASN